MQRLIFGVLATAMVLIVPVACADEPAVTGDAQTAGDAGTVARVGGEAVTAAELEAAIGSSLMKIRQQLHDARLEGLRQLIYDRLVGTAAAEQGVPPAQYLESRLANMIGTPTDAEIAGVMAQLRNRLREDDAEAREQVVAYLNQQARQRAEAALRDELFAANDVVFLLDPPRAEVAVVEHNPSRGAEDAPVTVVEYTDFQCPYCMRVQPTIDQVMKRYDGKVRHVFKHLPLPFHKQARLAAEASMCAADGGKFWQMHDWIFANGTKLGRASLVAAAVEMGVAEAGFTECLDQHRHAGAVDADMAEARLYSIVGTPGFMINGRFISGAQPFDAFAKIIDDELRRAGVASGEADVAEEPPSS